MLNLRAGAPNNSCYLFKNTQTTLQTQPGGRRVRRLAGIATIRGADYKLQDIRFS